MSQLHVQEGRDVQDEGPEPSSYPANDMAFTQASVSFCTAQADPQYSSPNLDHNGIGERFATKQYSMCAGLVWSAL